MVAATAGRGRLQSHEGVFVADYLPGAGACERAVIVVGNGGSPGVNQALACGRPVLGVCSNLDQFLNMQAVTAHGAGLMLRSDALTPARVRQSIRQLREPWFAAAAEALKAPWAGLEPAEVLDTVVSRLLASGSSGRR